ncbi:MAG: ADOP family duplicated permease [Bryobacteraceae bacterium]
MVRDCVIAWRGLRRSPLFAVMAVATLALGIGANATIFSIVNAVLLRPLPGFETQRLVRIQDATRTAGLGYVGPEVFKKLRAEARSFEQMAGMQFCQFNVTGEGAPEQVWGPCVTSNWFTLQRAEAMLGRTFLPDEDQPGRNRVVVLDHSFWMQRFGGRRDIVGQRILLDQKPWVVIGVMPADFRPLGATASSIFTPYVLDQDAAGLYVTARLKGGVTLEQARAELGVLGPRVREAGQELRLDATPVLEDITGPAAPMLRVLQGAVLLVLLIACGNVANLLLARAGARQKELRIREALGAPRWRIARFLIAEALLLSAAASVVAVVVARMGIALARPLLEGLPRAGEVVVDWRVFVVCLGVGLVTALAFGSLPVVLRKQRARRWQGGLVALEVAVAVVLVVGSGLLLQTFAAMRAVGLGYEPRNVLTHFYSLPPSADGSRTMGMALYGRLRERIAGLPGVVDVATTSTLPMGGVAMTMDVQVEGQPARRGARQASMVIVSDGYFRAAKIPLLSGRGFGGGDREGTTPVVMVSQSIANRYFGGKALGRRLVLPRVDYNVTGGGEVMREIVGVVGNICVNSVSDCEVEHIYLPESQNGLRMAYFVIRTAGEPLGMAAAVKRVAAEESPVVPFDAPQTLEQRAGYLTAEVRQGMWLIGVFAALAALLAASGVYGVSTYLAGLRRKEMGIRVAVGATFGDIARLVYGQTLGMALVGLACGVVAALWMTRFVRGMLFAVSPYDPATLALAAAGLAALVVLAATPSAWRAARADAAAELRRE